MITFPPPQGSHARACASCWLVTGLVDDDVLAVFEARLDGARTVVAAARSGQVTRSGGVFDDRFRIGVPALYGNLSDLAVERQRRVEVDQALAPFEDVHPHFPAVAPLVRGLEVERVATLIRAHLVKP